MKIACATPLRPAVHWHPMPNHSDQRTRLQSSQAQPMVGAGRSGTYSPGVGSQATSGGIPSCKSDANATIRRGLATHHPIRSNRRERVALCQGRAEHISLGQRGYRGPAGRGGVGGKAHHERGGGRRLQPSRAWEGLMLLGGGGYDIAFLKEQAPIHETV